MRIKKKSKKWERFRIAEGRFLFFLRGVPILGDLLMRKKNLTIDVNFPDELRHFRFRRIAS